MIKDVKTYFSTVTSRLSNAFDVQDFGLEEEAEFWSLAAEHLSRKAAPTFRDISEWMDLLFKAPAHLVYVKEKDKLRFFRQHIISANMEFLYERMGEEKKSTQNQQQVIRDFEDRLSNIESRIRYQEEFKMMGTSSFTIGQCQHIPLFKDDEFWGIYCVGPYVQTPKKIVPRLSIITRILTNFLSERYDKQTKLKYSTDAGTKDKSDEGTKAGFNIEGTAGYLVRYLMDLTSAKAALITEGQGNAEVIYSLNLPQDLQETVEVSLQDKELSVADLLKEHREAFSAHELYKVEEYPLNHTSNSATLYLFYSDEVMDKPDTPEVAQEVQDALGRLTHFRDQNKRFASELLHTYYTMLRAVEQRNDKTAYHTPRMLAFCSHFADLFGLQAAEKETLLNAARFHDIGYVELGHSSMGAELEHPIAGRNMLEGLSLPDDVTGGIATHHEWVDGSGTPRGLKAEEIPWTGKIISIFEFVIQFIENNRQDSVKAESEYKDELVAALLDRTGKQFDMIIIPTAVELIKDMTWQKCCNLGTENDE